LFRAGYGQNSQAIKALGQSKGGFSTKIHALVDALGNPLKFIFMLGQRHDIVQVKLLTEQISDTAVIANKGYDSNCLVNSLHGKNCTAVIPCKENSAIL
jgi:hypothetical protein